jgi:hypothetical protein
MELSLISHNSEMPESLDFREDFLTSKWSQTKGKPENLYAQSVRINSKKKPSAGKRSVFSAAISF